MRIDPRSGHSPQPSPQQPRRQTTGRRTAAVLSLAGALWMAARALVVAIDDFPRGLLVLLCVLLAAAGVGEGVLRRGGGRVAALAVAGAAAAAIGILVVDQGFAGELLLV